MIKIAAVSCLCCSETHLTSTQTHTKMRNVALIRRLNTVSLNTWAQAPGSWISHPCRGPNALLGCVEGEGMKDVPACARQLAATETQCAHSWQLQLHKSQADSDLGCTRQSITSRSRWSFCSTQHCGGHTWRAGSHSGPPAQERPGQAGASPAWASLLLPTASSWKPLFPWLLFLCCFFLLKRSREWSSVCGKLHHFSWRRLPAFLCLIITWLLSAHNMLPSASRFLLHRCYQCPRECTGLEGTCTTWPSGLIFTPFLSSSPLLLPEHTKLRGQLDEDITDTLDQGTSNPLMAGLFPLSMILWTSFQRTGLKFKSSQVHMWWSATSLTRVGTQVCRQMSCWTDGLRKVTGDRF